MQIIRITTTSLCCILAGFISSVYIEWDWSFISPKYAVTCGINAGFGGFNISLSEKDNQQVVDFAGLTFRKDRCGDFGHRGHAIPTQIDHYK